MTGAPTPHVRAAAGTIPSPRFDEWRSGWRLLLASFLGAIVSAVPLNTIGVFMPHLTAAFGWSQSAIAAVVPLNGWTIALTAPFVGHLLDTYGTRRFGIAGAIALPAAIAGLSLLTPAIGSYWLGWLVIALAETCGNIMIWTVPVARHFSDHRGTALAIVLLGNSVTGIVYAPLATLAIAHWGWRWAYAASGLGCALLLIPAVLACFRDPGAAPAALSPGGAAPAALSPGGAAPAPVPGPPPGLTRAEAMRTRRFWLLALAILLGAGTTLALFVLMIPVARSLGLSRTEAATMVSAIGIGSVTAKPIVGPIADRVSAAPLAALTLLGPTATILIFLFVHPLAYAGAFAACVLVGVATGMEIDMIGVIVARHFGMRQFARIYGAMQCVFQLAAGGGAFLLGLGHDLAGGYRAPLAIGAALLLIASGLLLGMGPERFPRRPAAAAIAG